MFPPNGSVRTPGPGTDLTAQKQTTVRRITGDGVLDGLINNAGVLPAPGPVEFQKIEDIRAVFDVNVFGIMAVTIALLRLLGTDPVRRQPGRIINISSIEGKVASPFISAYPATKHAIEGFSSSLRRELRLFGMIVREEVSESARTAIPVAAVVRAVEHAMTARNPKTRYLVGRDAWLWLLLNFLSDRWRGRLILSKLIK
jgi:NAD(P)-dependent dehydrogenase (short-subunit alcohol dehydrogenase family)